MFEKILIANRGEIACRVIKTAKRLGVKTVAIYSDADRNALHVKQADEAFRIGGVKASDSYLRLDRIVKVALRSGVQAVHPGYGFLSENADFAEACQQNNIVFIGPDARTIRQMGSKSRSKSIMQAAGVPLIPGYHGDTQEEHHLQQKAEEIGFPILIKASAGGGGKGMRLVENAKAFLPALAAAKREAINAFADDKVLLEKYLTAPKHIEVQILGDQHGNVIHLFERDCSVQRRYQKVLEEAPAPQLSNTLRQSICEAALRAAQAVQYVGAGTVEFIVQNDAFYFMEMNTRLQVEHPVTEMITGIDLVECQLNIACADALEVVLGGKPLKTNGHAVEARIYAERPANDFLPSTGTVEQLIFPASKHIRIDSGLQVNDKVTVYYDPMLAKISAWGATRDEALHRLRLALEQTRIAGLDTNVSFLRSVLAHDNFRQGDYTTRLLDESLQSILPSSSASAEENELHTICAALHVCRPHDVDQTISPWIDDSWRPNLDALRTIRFDTGSNIVLVRMTAANKEYGLKVFINDDDHNVAELRYVSGDQISFLLNNVLIKASAITTARGIEIFVNNTHRVVSLFDPSIQTTRTNNDGTIVSPMPGRIVSVPVKPNEAVKKDQPIVVLEAMKMEHTLLAPIDGVVTELNATAEQQVNEGHTIAVIQAKKTA